MRCARGECRRAADVAVHGGVVVLVMCFPDAIVVAQHQDVRVVALRSMSTEVTIRPREA